MKPIRAWELFCCSGGMAEGFRRAGIDFELAFDFDPNACNSYEANLGHRPVQMDARDLLRLLRAGAAPTLDLFVADPPCTPWSRAGKRKGLGDDRDMLQTTIDIIEELMPRCWLIGNVPGLDDADNWQTVVVPVVYEWARRVGYCVDYAKFDAADYGVPQRRIRPFWFGHLSGAPCLKWPEPTHARSAATQRQLPGISELASWVTCADALGHLPPNEIGRPVRLRWKAETDHRPSEPSEPGKTITTNPNSDGALLHVADPTHNSITSEPAKVQTCRGSRRESLLLNAKHPINRPDAPSYTVTARDRGGAQGAGAMVWPWDRPATTVQCDPRIPPPGHHGNDSYMSTGIVLSERARAILQGFPEGWIFAGKTKKARDSQIGQAMPPGLAEAVARSVMLWATGRDCPRPALEKKWQQPNG